MKAYGDWLGPRVGLDDVEKRNFLTLPGLELRQPVASRYTGCSISVSTAVARTVLVVNLRSCVDIQVTKRSAIHTSHDCWGRDILPHAPATCCEVAHCGRR
jgi:hypothetical protein